MNFANSTNSWNLNALYVHDTIIVILLLVIHILLIELLLLNLIYFVIFRHYCGPCGTRGRCRISPPRFLAESRKRRLNQDSFVSAVCLVVYFL